MVASLPGTQPPTRGRQGWPKRKLLQSLSPYNKNFFGSPPRGRPSRCGPHPPSSVTTARFSLDNQPGSVVYGGALRRYLLLDAIAGTLLKASKPNVDWIFTGDKLLSELEGQLHGKMIVIEPTNIDPLSEAGEWQNGEVGEIIMQVTSTGNPVKLIFNAADESETKKIAEKLSELSKDLDFTEPLNRVGEALAEICENGTE